MPAPLLVKLGGSLITDKTRPRTVRADALRRLAHELAAFWAAHPQQPLVVGHGSGSFGHWAAREHGWTGRAQGPQGRRALLAIAQAAAALHAQVLDALRAAGLPAWSFPPSAQVVAHAGQVHTWDLAALRQALAAGLVPVVYGDTVLDRAWGGVILSTEDLFVALTPHLRPRRILLAGLEPGVWRDWPHNTALWDDLTPARWRAARHKVGGAQGADVTGGMHGKVQRMLDLVQAFPGLEVRIFSGQQPGALTRALEGQPVGTRLRADAPPASEA